MNQEEPIMDRAKRELLDFLTENNLIIVSKDLVKDRAKIDNLMRKKALSIGEIFNNKIYDVKSRQTLKNWCHRGKFKQYKDWYVGEKQQIMIYTHAIMAFPYKRNI